MVRSISGVEVSLMILNKKISCRINFRSKGKLSVNDIANEIGGGGHAYAAGAGQWCFTEVISKVVDLTTISIEKKMKGI